MKFTKILFPFLLVLALFLRLANLPGRLTFDWDQGRDLEIMQTIFQTHSLPLLGPVAQGSTGGFHLAPYYYYLLAPVYFLFGQNPLSFAVLSIGADLLVILGLYFCARRHFSPFTSLSLSLVWAVSTLTINSSLTPTNISFISLWVIGVIVFLTPVQLSFQRRFFALLLLGFATSIHLTLIPIAVILFLIYLPRFSPRSRQEVISFLFALFLPQLPLLIFDFTHSFANIRALAHFLLVRTRFTSALPFWPAFFTKLDLTFARLLFGTPLPWFGLGLLILTLVYSFSELRSSNLLKLSFSIIATLLLSLIAYHDFNFAEYYLTALFVPFFLTLGALLARLTARFNSGGSLIVMALLLFFPLFSNLTHFSSATQPYSLAVKERLVRAAADLGYPLEFRIKLPSGRDTALNYLLAKHHLVSDPAAARKAYFLDSSVVSPPAPEEARSIIYEKVVAGLKLVVFSN